MGLSFCSDRARTQTDRLPLAYLQHTPSVLSHTYTCILVLVLVYVPVLVQCTCTCAILDTYTKRIEINTRIYIVQ